MFDFCGKLFNFSMLTINFLFTKLVILLMYPSPPAASRASSRSFARRDDGPSPLSSSASAVDTRASRAAARIQPWDGG